VAHLQGAAMSGRVRNIVELTCKEIVEIIGDYLAGDMPPDDLVVFEQHVHACTWCMDYLDQMRATRALTGTLREEALPETTKRQLLDAFRHLKRK
jgi:predicted anti-sigma-YlaC factor YlaD